MQYNSHKQDYKLQLYPTRHQPTIVNLNMNWFELCFIHRQYGIDQTCWRIRY